VPDLIIEVLSPGKSNHDLVTKKDLYQKFGVQEYWIVTPETKETRGFLLKNGSYSESGRYTGKIRSVILDNTLFEF
jgi:Uma2 family endonuclease